MDLCSRPCIWENQFQIGEKIETNSTTREEISKKKRIQAFKSRSGTRALVHGFRDAHRPGLAGVPQVGRGAQGPPSSTASLPSAAAADPGPGARRRERLGSCAPSLLCSAQRLEVVAAATSSAPRIETKWHMVLWRRREMSSCKMYLSTLCPIGRGR
jgi:hypothetical protein